MQGLKFNAFAGDDAVDPDKTPKEDARRVDEPSGRPPDAELAYDPEMTDTDEANIPADSAADPQTDTRG